MATLPVTAVTLSEWAKRIGPDGTVDAPIELLSQQNDINEDQLYREGNLPTGHRTTVRTGLPTIYWHIMNIGTPASKSTTAQVDESIGSMEAWSNVDTHIAELEEQLGPFRLSEATPFFEAFAQKNASTLFYGNASVDPEQYTGLSPRYSDLAAGNAQNVIDAGGTGGDNTSIWLIVWGENEVCGIFPKGSQAGLKHEDLGLVTVQTSTDLGGGNMRAYQDYFNWRTGLAVKDWRAAVRIANIDISEITADYNGSDGFSYDLQQLMIRATHRLPASMRGRARFYCNRTIRQVLDIQALEKSSSQLTVDTWDGKPITKFLGLPVRTCDALLETEARVV